MNFILNRRLILQVILLTLFFFAPTQFASAQGEGRLVKTSDSTAVYYVDDQGNRHAFPNQKVYASWYKDFSLVETITQSEMSSYPLSKNVLYRPGSRLIKVPSVSQVYAVEPFGKLKNIPSEEVAIQLYGENWADLVDDIDISFFFDYSISGSIEVFDSLAVYPVGTLIAFNQQNYLMDQRSDGLRIMRPISDDGWKSNNFVHLRLATPGWAFLPLFVDLGPVVTSFEQQFSCTFCSSGTFARVSVKESELEVDDKYSVEIPDTFSVNFGFVPGDLESPLQVYESDLRASDDFIERIQLIFWNTDEFEDYNDFIDEQSKFADEVLFNQSSLTYPGMNELIFEQNDTHYRYLITETENHFEVIRLIADKNEFTRYIDVFDLVVETLQYPSP